LSIEAFGFVSHFGLRISDLPDPPEAGQIGFVFSPTAVSGPETQKIGFVFAFLCSPSARIVPAPVIATNGAGKQSPNLRTTEWNRRFTQMYADKLIK
jgi:hypothetical protein